MYTNIVHINNLVFHNSCFHAQFYAMTPRISATHGNMNAPLLRSIVCRTIAFINIRVEDKDKTLHKLHIVGKQVCSYYRNCMNKTGQ